MLQNHHREILSAGERYETLHRATVYTNYRMFGIDRLETPAGVLLNTAGLGGVSALTCEMVEKIEKHPDGDKPGVMISTGGDTLMNDFAAVTAFALNITCTPDLDLTRRLLATDRPSLGCRLSRGSSSIARSTKRSLLGGGWRCPSHFLHSAGRPGAQAFRGRHARRPSVHHRPASHPDNLSSAYALLVMSIEALAHQFDGHVAEWEDYDHRERQKVDVALEGASDETIEKVRRSSTHR